MEIASSRHGPRLRGPRHDDIFGADTNFCYVGLPQSDNPLAFLMAPVQEWLYE